MAAKVFLIICAQALLIQFTFSQRINRGAVAGPMGSLGQPNRGWGYEGPAFDSLAWNRGLGCAGPIDFTPTNGGSLPVTSSSSFAPTGLSIFSETAYEGPLAVIGELPFLGTVALEGAVPTVGAGAISYGCGNGVTAMVSEGFGPEFGGPGAAPAFGNRFGYEGCGRGLMY